MSTQNSIGSCRPLTDCHAKSVNAEFILDFALALCICSYWHIESTACLTFASMQAVDCHLLLY